LLPHFEQTPEVGDLQNLPDLGIAVGDGDTTAIFLRVLAQKQHHTKRRAVYIFDIPQIDYIFERIAAILVTRPELLMRIEIESFTDGYRYGAGIFIFANPNCRHDTTLL
jgi:hypothetical protein